MRVCELFGPTLQGEGPSQGHPAVFVRLMGCNLNCSWCDTPFTWDWKGQNGVAYDRDDFTQLAPEDVAGWVQRTVMTRSTIVVVTGGEPMLQQQQVWNLADLVPGHRVEVETNGTRTPVGPIPSNVHFSISPKLANSGIPEARRWKPNVVAALLQQRMGWLKYVVAHPADLFELDRQLDELDALGVAPPVWLMPEARSAAAVLGSFDWVYDTAARRGWHATPRLQVLAHGDERGY